MRFRCSAALLVQVSQPTANRAVRDFEAPGDLRLALLASLARAQHPLTQVCRIRAPHDRSSLQGITLPPSTERRLDQPVLPHANRSNANAAVPRGAGLRPDVAAGRFSRGSAVIPVGLAGEKPFP